MQSVLIVSGSAKGSEHIKEIFSNLNACSTVVTSGGEARRVLNMQQYDFVVINAPLGDELGDNLAIDAASDNACGVILLVKEEISDTVAVRVEQSGVVVLPKPISRKLLYTAIKFIDVTRKRLLGLKNENIRLQQKIEEMRLVTRAKCVLIQYLNMTEQQAHKYIEKQAMDMRSTKKSIALGILSTYEN